MAGMNWDMRYLGGGLVFLGVLLLIFGGVSAGLVLGVIGGVVLSATMLLLSLHVTLWPVVATLVFIAGAGAGPITPLTVSLVSRYAPQQKMSVVALCQIVAGLGSAAGPRMVGQIGDAYSLTIGLMWAAAFFMATVLPIAALLIWYKATGHHEGRP